MEVIRESGVSRMSLDNVAERAGVSKPTIYRRYRGKTELAVAAIVEACRPEGPGPTPDALADLVGMLAYFRRHFESEIRLPTLGSLLQESRSAPGLLAAFRKNAIGVFRKHLLMIVERAQAEGLIAPRADGATVVEMLVGAYYARAIIGKTCPSDWEARLLAGSNLLTPQGERALARIAGKHDRAGKIAQQPSK